MDIAPLVEQRYSRLEAERFVGYQLSAADRKILSDAAMFVLETVPKSKSVNACAPMSALWAAAVRDNSRIPVHVSVGNLSINGRRIYYSEASAEALHRTFLNSTLSFDGHVWLSIPGGVGEIALFRSAYGHPEGHWLRGLITGMFGPGRGVLMGPPTEGMNYEPLFVLSDGEITGVIKGAKSLFTALDG